MLPQTIGTPLKLVVQPLATFALNQAFPGTTLVDNDNPKFRVNLPFAIPVTASRAHFDFGRKNQFFSHGFCRVGIGNHESLFSTNGSMKFLSDGYNWALVRNKQETKKVNHGH